MPLCYRSLSLCLWRTEVIAIVAVGIRSHWRLGHGRVPTFCLDSSMYAWTTPRVRLLRAASCPSTTRATTTSTSERESAAPDAMGTAFSRNFARFWNRNERRLLLLGLDAAGKTTILYRLRLGKTIASIPTVGFNVETVRYDRYKLHIWVCASVLHSVCWCVGSSHMYCICLGRRRARLAATVLATPLHRHTGTDQPLTPPHTRRPLSHTRALGWSRASSLSSIAPTRSASSSQRLSSTACSWTTSSRCVRDMTELAQEPDLSPSYATERLTMYSPVLCARTRRC